MTKDLRGAFSAPLPPHFPLVHGDSWIDTSEAPHAHKRWDALGGEWLHAYEFERRYLTARSPFMVFPAKRRWRDVALNVARGVLLAIIGALAGVGCVTIISRWF